MKMPFILANYLITITGGAGQRGAIRAMVEVANEQFKAIDAAEANAPIVALNKAMGGALKKLFNREFKTVTLTAEQSGWSVESVCDLLVEGYAKQLNQYGLGLGD